MRPRTLILRTAGTNCDAETAYSQHGRIEDRWIPRAPHSRKCIWAQGSESHRPGALPVAHGEGRLIPASEPVRQALWDEEQVGFPYANHDGSPAGGEFPANP